MIKTKTLHIYFLLVVLLASAAHSIQAQNKIDSIAQKSAIGTTDSTIIKNDTLKTAFSDSSLMVTDTIASDTTLTDSTLTDSKFDFLTTGGNDSTYYSFYGHLFNVDDTIPIEFWNYNNQVHELEIQAYDSTLQDLQINHPAFRNSINNGYLGNTGLAVNSNIFAEPNPHSGFIFMQSFTPYMFQANNTRYYNVIKPFTVFKVDMGSKEEQNLDILHTQNINKYFNAHVHFKNYSGEGSYINQKTRNNTGSLGATYTKGRLASHFDYVFSRIEAQENGGIIDDSLIMETEMQPTEVGTRLTGGSNFIKDRQLYYDQKLGFLKTNVPDSAELGAYWFSLQYTYHQHKSSRIYKDENDRYILSNGDSTHLYDSTFNGGATIDSNSYLFKNHNFRLNLEENPKSYPFVGTYVGYGIESTDYFYSFNKDTAGPYQQSNNKSSAYFEAGMYRLKGKRFKFSGNYKIYISGYKASNMQLDGFISNKFGRNKKQVELKAEGILSTATPDYFLANYASNHYQWLNSFETEKRTTLKFSINAPFIKTNIGTRFNLLGDYIYFNENGLPTQHNKVFSVFDVYLKNTLKLGPIALYTRLNYQNTGNEEVLPLPTFSGYAAIYWNPTLHFQSTGGQLKLQLGADAYYWTSYYGQAYSPALAQYHNQTDKKVGNYPFVGGFWNVEIKRLRFYVRLEHATYKYVEPRNYFYTPNYPTNRFNIRYGIVWTFYD